MTCRRIQFDGEDADYIRFLEAKVLELQETLRSETRSGVAKSSGDKGDLDETSNRREAPRHANNSPGPVPEALGTCWNGTLTSSETRDDGDTDSDFQALQVIEYDPTHEPTHNNKQVRGVSGEKQRNIRNISKLASSLNELSRSEAWFDWNPENKRVILLRGFVQGHSWQTPCSSSSIASRDLPTPFSNSTEASILFDYATSIITESTTNRQAACVQEFLFVSLCAVTLRSNEDTEKDKVYDIMRKFLRCDSQVPQLQKLIRGAKWANKAISLLTSSFKARAWDFLFLAEHPVSYYARFSDGSLGPEELISRMELDDHHLGDESEKNNAIPLAVPLIIERIFRNTVPLEDICECLGYISSSVKEYQSQFNDALNSFSGIKRPNISTQSGMSKRHCPDSFSQLPDRDKCIRQTQAFDTTASPSLEAQQAEIPELQSISTNQVFSSHSSSSNVESFGQTGALSTNSELIAPNENIASQTNIQNLARNPLLNANFLDPARQPPVSIGVPDLAGDPLLGADFFDPTGDPPINDDFPGLAGDPLLGADFFDPTGDPPINIDFPGLAGDPLLGADFFDPTGDPPINDDFPGLAGDPLLGADFFDPTGDPPIHDDFPNLGKRSTGSDISNLVGNLYMSTEACSLRRDSLQSENIGPSSVTPEVC